MKNNECIRPTFGIYRFILLCRKGMSAWRCLVGSCTVSFHIGVFCFDARQFGEFHFGDFHFDAVPVRRVSLWRASSSARFSLARFHFGAFLFGAFPNFDPVSANASFARTVSFLRINAFYASLARISFCVAYLFALMFPICEEVFSTPV